MSGSRSPGEVTPSPVNRRGRRSRRKGSNGESEARKAWAERGFRPVPWRGGVDGPDFVAIAEAAGGRGVAFSVEVTRDSTRIPARLYLNIEKAKKGPGIPIARLRRDREKALVVMTEEDFFNFVLR